MLLPGSDSASLGAAAACWLVTAETWTSRHNDSAIGMPLPLPEAEEKLKAMAEGTVRFCRGPSAMSVTGARGSTQKSTSLHRVKVSMTLTNFSVQPEGSKHKPFTTCCWTLAYSRPVICCLRTMTSAYSWTSLHSLQRSNLANCM